MPSLCRMTVRYVWSPRFSPCHHVGQAWWHTSLGSISKNKCQRQGTTTLLSPFLLEHVYRHHIVFSFKDCSPNWNGLFLEGKWPKHFNYQCKLLVTVTTAKSESFSKETTKWKILRTKSKCVSCTRGGLCLVCLLVVWNQGGSVLDKMEKCWVTW